MHENRKINLPNIIFRSSVFVCWQPCSQLPINLSFKLIYLSKSCLCGSRIGLPFTKPNQKPIFLWMMSHFRIGNLNEKPIHIIWSQATSTNAFVVSNVTRVLMLLRLTIINLSLEVLNSKNITLEYFGSNCTERKTYVIVLHFATELLHDSILCFKFCV